MEREHMTLLRISRVIGLVAKWLGKARQASGESARWADPAAKEKARRAVQVARRMLGDLERRLGEG